MKKYFLTGLATLLPLALTVWVALFIIKFLTAPFIDVVTHIVGAWPIPHNLIRAISQLLILLALFLFIVGLGLVARWFLFKSLIKIGDRLLHKIPLVNKVYKPTKDIIQSLFNSEKKTFQQVVMLSFPYPGCYTLGLISREAPATCSKAFQSEMVSVFIPTTPNPTTGYMVLRPQSELIVLDMQPDEAIKYIVSCGVVAPSHTPGTR